MKPNGIYRLLLFFFTGHRTGVIGLPAGILVSAISPSRSVRLYALRTMHYAFLPPFTTTLLGLTVIQAKSL